jgi:hypothetical protein
MKDIYNVKDVLSGDAIKKLEQKLGGTLAFLVLETTDEEPILVTSSGFGAREEEARPAVSEMRIANAAAGCKYCIVRNGPVGPIHICVTKTS